MLACLPDDVRDTIFLKVYNLRMQEVLNELRELFLCPFYDNHVALTWETWLNCPTIENVGGMAFASMNRLTRETTWCSLGISDVTSIMNDAWRLFEFLCAIS